MKEDGYISITELGLGKLQWQDVAGWCSVDSLKAHLIIEHGVDNQLIKDYAVSAWNLAETTIERPLKELIAEYGGVMPAPIIHAVRLLVGRFYAEREGESYTNRREIGFGISALLMPYKGIARKVGDAGIGKIPDAVIPSDSAFYKRYAPVADYLGCQICELTEWEMLWLSTWRARPYGLYSTFDEYVDGLRESRGGGTYFVDGVLDVVAEQERKVAWIQPVCAEATIGPVSLFNWLHYWIDSPEAKGGAMPSFGLNLEEAIPGVYSYLANVGYIVDETGDKVFNETKRYMEVLLRYDYTMLGDEEWLISLEQYPYGHSLAARVFQAINTAYIGYPLSELDRISGL